MKKDKLIEEFMDNLSSCDTVTVSLVGVGETSYKTKEIYLAIREAITQIEINGLTSDGHHTFDELYFHRMVLFSVICNQNVDKAWKSKKHSDGTMFGDDWIIVGIKTERGQYSYHYKMECWDYFRVKELDFAPEWDGHQPSDVTRLWSLWLESEATK